MSHLALISESFEKEYKEQEALFKAQPPIVQRFLEAQARQMAEVFVQRGSRIHFSLPDCVVLVTNGEASTLTVRQNCVSNQRADCATASRGSMYTSRCANAFPNWNNLRTRGSYQRGVDPPHNGHAYDL